MKAEKQLYIKAYGCQMNVYDADRLADLMRIHGYTLTNTPEHADMVVLNTCHIREKAAEKMFSDLGRLRPFKTQKEEAGGEMILVVTGCTAQAEGEEIIRRMPYVDLVCGPQSYHRLPEMLAKYRRGKGSLRHRINTEFPLDSKFDLLPEQTCAPSGASAFLTIQEGCDKFCTFCCVPYTRGAEVSRSPENIIREAEHLVALGAKEVTLLGQNVNAYSMEDVRGVRWSLGRLLRALSEIEGLERLRYTTSHPRDVDEELIEAHRDLPKLMPFLHLPVQSGSDRILEAMNRKHTAQTYLHIIERLRKAQPKIAFSSDFIVGFPGETDRDFADTLRLVQEVGFAQAYSFSYSPRPGTPAAALEDQVPQQVKEERLSMLQELLRAQMVAFNTQMEGQIVPVLFDRKGRHENQVLGKSPHMQSVHVVSQMPLHGQIKSVRVTRVHPMSLEGELVEPV